MTQPWALMWAIALTIYAGGKWFSYHEARAHHAAPDRLLAFGYLLAWPGMDANAFVWGKRSVPAPRVLEWIAAALKTAIGATLIWIVARSVLPEYPLLSGWLAMAGIVMVLHFGSFHLLSLGWRSVGVNAMPVMRNPLQSTSLAEFWGRRWNTAFHELATHFAFRPLRPVVGRAAATVLAFLISGLIHELVITVPARGGYGLPTLYFALQGLGVAGEQTSFGRRLGLGRGWRGWMFTVVVAAGPAFWLFAPPFVRTVILPMLSDIGAT